METMSIMAGSGVKHIELFMQRPHFDPSNSEHVIETSRALFDSGIRAISAHAPIYKDRTNDLEARKLLILSLCDEKESERRIAGQELEAAIDTCSTLGIYNLVVHTGITGDPGSDDVEEEIDRCIGALHRQARSACEKGINLSLENGTSPGTSVQLLKYVIDGLGMPNVGICIDVGHSNLFSNPVEDIKEAMPRLHSLHLHDNDGEGDLHLIPGEGTIDFDSIAAFLQKRNFNGICTFEIGAPKNRTGTYFQEMMLHARRTAQVMSRLNTVPK